MRLHRKAVRPMIECLEDRTVPAISVIQDFNLLTVTDATGPVVITITQKLADSVRVSVTENGVNRPVVRGAATGVNQGIVTIRYTGTVNADTVVVNLNGFALPGGLTIVTAEGADAVNVRNGGVGKLVIDTAAGADKITVGSEANLNINGELLIRSGKGDDSVTVGNNVSTTKVADNIDIRTGAGNVQVGILSTQVTNGVGVTTGNGNDSIALQGDTIGGALNILTGAGDDGVALQSTATTPLTVNGAMNATDTGGDDTFGVEEFGVRNLFLGTFAVRGFNTVNLGSDGAATFQSPVSVTLGPDTTALAVTVNGGTAGRETIFNGSLSITGGAGSDSVTLVDGVIVNGITSANLGKGANSFVGGFAQVSTLTVNTGADADAFDLSGMTATGNVTLSAGAGVNTFGMAGNFNVSRNLTINAGADSDVVGTVQGIVGGSLTFNLGDGDQTVTLAAPASILGDLAFNLGTGNNTLADTAGMALGGTLRIRMTGTTGGNNSYIANRTGTYNMAVTFGNGNDAFTANAGAILAGVLSGGAGTDTFTPNGADITGLRVLGFE